MNPAFQVLSRTTLAALLLLASPARAALNVIPSETDFTWKAPGYVPDELLVKFKSNVSTASAMKVLLRKGATAKRLLTPDGLIQVRIPAGQSLSAAFDSLNAQPEVEYATVNGYAQGFSAPPNDTLFDEFDLTWNLRNVGAVKAWDTVTGSPSVVLAMIDTGVAYEDHPIPDYEIPFVKPGVTKYRQSPELPGPFLPGYDFVNNDSHPNDDCGHGTFTATVAAGRANNLAGAAGIAWGVTILPIKSLRFDAGGEMAPIVQGIRYAADQGADIANLSLGFPPVGQLHDRLDKKFVRDFFRPLKESIQYAQSRGVICVAAAGNFTSPELSLPAGYPGVISVGATGVDNRIASYSSFGPGLDFMAPGGDFTELNGDHIQDAVADLGIKPFRSQGSLCNPDSLNIFFFFGTSGAAPHVSGAVALLMSMGIRSQGQIEELLRATAINPFGRPSNGQDEIYGAGIIQIDKAVELAAARRAGVRVALGASDRPELRILGENPTRGASSVSFRLTRPGEMSVQLYDVNGRLVRTLQHGRAPAGERTLRWDGKDDHGGSVGSGVYFFRVATPDGVEQRKVAVLR